MKKKVILSIISVVVVALVGMGIYVHSMFGQIKRTELPANDKDMGIITPPPASAEKKNDVVNIALFGLDARSPHEASRSDTMMVLSIDKTNQNIKVSSLMRDLYVPIPGKSDDRLNAAYAYGGPVLALKTINTDFGLDIRNFVTVNFFGLEKLIDKVGGVQIKVSSAEAEVLNQYLDELNSLNGNKVPYVKAGLQTLDGRQAVAYARIRYVGHGDYERTERQRTVLNLIFNKIKAQGITKLPGLISMMLPYVETSMSNGDILSLASEVYKYKVDGLQQFRIPVDGFYKSQQIRGMDVLVPDLEANKEKLQDFIYESENNTVTK